jgi:glycosyltransferase involved in cell wall biosynthesis
MTADAVGGVWTYALELTRALAKADVDVLLAVMGPPPTATQAREAQAIANLHLICGAFKLEWMDEPWEDVRRAGAWLLDWAARWAPDVVHLNGYCHGALPWNVPAIIVGHSCVLSWWQAVIGEPAPARWDRYRREVAGGLAAADLVIAPSRAMLEALREHYSGAGTVTGADESRSIKIDESNSSAGVGAGRSAHPGAGTRAIAEARPAPPRWKGRPAEWTGRALVIPNGRSAERFPAGRKEPIVLTAGRLWDRAKNVAALAAVAPRLTWPVYAAGPATEPERTTTETSENLKAAAAIRGLGALSSDQLARWFSRASIVALPARYEPFGLSALEAALAGCALVLGDIPSLREIWGDAAWFVAPDDVDGLHAAIAQLIADEGVRTRLAAAAQARAQQYSPERMAARYLDAYEHHALLSLAGL